MGIDIETVPTMLKFQSSSPSLLQLAVDDKIFVIDLLQEKDGFAADAFNRFVTQICQNNKMLKVGSSLEDRPRPR